MYVSQTLLAGRELICFHYRSIDLSGSSSPDSPQSFHSPQSITSTQTSSPLRRPTHLRHPHHSNVVPLGTDRRCRQAGLLHAVRRGGDDQGLARQWAETRGFRRQGEYGHHPYPDRTHSDLQDGETFETPVTLIALHHGELLLPKVAVHALPLEGQGRMRSMIVPSCETCQLHGAERILVLPRGGRTTFVVDMGDYTDGG